MRAMNTMSAITSSVWIRFPPRWKLNPSSQRIRRITMMDHGIEDI
jgi:hypothetical protein